MTLSTESAADISSGKMRCWFNSALLGILLILSTCYAYLNARNDWYGEIFILALLFIVLPRFLGGCKEQQDGANLFSIFLAGYIGLAFLSIQIGQSEYINHNWFIKSFFRIVPVFLVVLLVKLHNQSDLQMLGYLLPGLCLTMSLTILLVDYGLIDKKSLAFLTPWHVVDSIGNRKVFSFYLLFLMWATIGFLWRQGKKKTILSVVIAILSVWALFTTTSESAQFAAVCGLFVFALVHLKIRRGRYWIYLFLASVFLLIPLLWLIFYPVTSRNPWEVYNDSSSFLRQNWAIGARVYLYEFCSELIRKQMIFGYGFGSTLQIPVPSGKLPGWSIFPGGHPHSIVFLFLLEHGMIGYLWLTGMFVLFFNRLYERIKSKIEEPAIWALLMSGIVVFSLSFSIWHSDVVLTYGWFFVFLLILMDKIRLGSKK